MTIERILLVDRYLILEKKILYWFWTADNTMLRELRTDKLGCWLWGHPFERIFNSIGKVMARETIMLMEILEKQKKNFLVFLVTTAVWGYFRSIKTNIKEARQSNNCPLNIQDRTTEKLSQTCKGAAIRSKKVVLTLNLSSLHYLEWNRHIYFVSWVRG